jgi:hypothetical protein
MKIDRGTTYQENLAGVTLHPETRQEDFVEKLVNTYL